MRKLVLALFIIISSSAVAQEQAIVTDRPTQSAASTVVPKNNLLLEAGFVGETFSADINNLTYMNLLVRFGILDGVELRLTQNYVGVEDLILDETFTGMSPLTIGTKVHLLEENGAIPQVSIIGQLTLKTGKESFQPESAFPEFRLNFSNSLSDKLSLGYNLGMAFPEEDANAFYTAVLGYVLIEGLTLFAEPYGSFAGEGDFDHRFNTGLIYLITDRFQVDVSAGWGLSEISPDSFVGFGLAVGF